jgi:hypothetical protein
MEDIFGEVIYSYSRKQAIDDGVLVDLNQFIPVHESGYKYPIVCTDTVWNIIDAAVQDKSKCNDYNGVVWDILHMSRNMQVKTWETGCLFEVIINGPKGQLNHILKIECSPGDNAEPVLTVMLPFED